MAAAAQRASGQRGQASPWLGGVAVHEQRAQREPCGRHGRVAVLMRQSCRAPAQLTPCCGACNTPAFGQAPPSGRSVNPPRAMSAAPEEALVLLKPHQCLGCSQHRLLLPTEEMCIPVGESHKPVSVTSLMLLAPAGGGCPCPECQGVSVPSVSRGTPPQGLGWRSRLALVGPGQRRPR